MTSPTNWQMVTASDGLVVVSRPKQVMTPREAVVHAGWLVVVAAALDPSMDFSGIFDSIHDAIRQEMQPSD